MLMIHTFSTGDKPDLFSGEYPFSNSPEILTTKHAMRIDADHFMIIGTSRTRETDSVVFPNFEVCGLNAVELILDEPFGYKYGNQGSDILVLESQKILRLRAGVSEKADNWVIEVESEIEELSAKDTAVFLTGLTEHIRLVREIRSSSQPRTKSRAPRKWGF